MAAFHLKCNVPSFYRAVQLHMEYARMIGTKIKELRTEMKLSVREVARRSGLSATMISQVERDVTQPSLSTLRKLSVVFGKSMSSVFAEEAQHAESVSGASLGISDVWIGKPGQRSFLSEPQSNFSYERLARGNGQLEVLRAKFEPGAVSSPQPWAHPSVECVYVIAGTLTAQIKGIEYVVQAGESLTFDASSPHLYHNDGDVVAEAIFSMAPSLP